MESTLDEDNYSSLVDKPTEDVVPSFSFSGCGFLGVYHIGVASCLRDHTDVVSRKEIKFAGASAGALVATTLLCDIDFGEMTRMFLEIAKVVRDKESVDLAALLRNVMDHYLPEDAHLRLRKRLYISMTILKTLKCGLVTDFNSKDHLIECLIASSYVPGFIGWIPPGMDGDCLVDVKNKPLPGYSSKRRKHRPPSTPSTSSTDSSTSASSYVTCETDLPPRDSGLMSPELDGVNSDGLLSDRVTSIGLSQSLFNLSSLDNFLLSDEDVDEEGNRTDYSYEDYCGSDEDEESGKGRNKGQGLYTTCVSLEECDSKSKNSSTSCDSKPLTNHMKKSYLGRLVWLCFRSVQKTTSVMRSVPMASRLMKSVSPSLLGDFEGFVEALLLEMVSNRYTVLDGGFSDNIPVFDKNTITVCPFAGESDICPRDLTAIDFSVDIGNTSFHYSDDNVYRLNHALKPMEPQMLLSLCEEGYNECLRFLHRKELLSCRRHLMTRACISPSPCNIGHAHCRCGRCLEADQKIRRSLSCVSCQHVKHRALNSILPSDVRNEFYKAIELFKASQPASKAPTFFNQLIDLLWWWAEKVYSSTMRIADLALDFQAWLLRFYDNMACFAKFAILPLGQKRKLIRYILSSLRLSIGATAKRSLSAVPKLHATICR